MDAGCRICGGTLQLRYRGKAAPLTPECFSPSKHEPGAHGDLFECTDCGCVVQPSLPGARELHELYRAMEDDHYLAEEDGRRRTARRMLDRIGRVAPGGRLLEVGCAYGLLLDEARARGYEVRGIELSTSAAAHARGALGLPVEEVALEDFDPGERFDVVVLADVIEHLQDPLGALDRCADLLADGGALCVVTPDPSSAVARVIGPRWWGYLPAHYCLLPRRTLCSLLVERGLEVAEDVPLVRSFSLGRWIQGLAERAGPLAGPLERLAATRVGGLGVSMSTFDERVVVARRVAARPPRDSEDLRTAPSGRFARPVRSARETAAR